MIELKEKRKKEKVARGPFFIVPNRETVLEWIESGVKRTPSAKKDISAAQEEFFYALAEHAPSTKENPITLADMTASISRFRPDAKLATLERRIRATATELTSIKILKREQERLLNARNQSCFTLRPPAMVFRELETMAAKGELDSIRRNKKTVAIQPMLPRERQKRMAAVRDNLLQRDDIIYPLAEFGTSEPWSMQLITQLMEKCSREHVRDKRKAIKAKAILSGRMVDVVAHTSTIDEYDDEADKIGLMIAADSQTILAIITLATQYIDYAQREGRPLVNKIPFDVLDLCTILGKERKGRAKDGVVKSLMRIIYSSFKISTKNSSDFNLGAHLGVHGMVGGETEFKIIQNYFIGIEGSGSQEEAETAYGKRWFTVSLHDSIWQSLLLGRHTRLVHPNLLLESSGYAHKLYSHIKMHTPLDSSIIRTTGDLYNYFGYAGRISNFRRLIRSCLLGDAEAKLPYNGKMIDFYGYRVKIEENPADLDLILTISLSQEELRRVKYENEKLTERSVKGQALLALN